MRKRLLIVLLLVICLVGYLKLIDYGINIVTEKQTEKQTSIIKLIPFGPKISRDVAVLNVLGK